METILTQLDNAVLSLHELDTFKTKVNKMIEDKKRTNYINWLIHQYNINKPFYFLNHGTVRYSTYDNITSYFAIEYPSRHDPEGWETKVCITFVNHTVDDVYYETDRYARFEYKDRVAFPYGHFQGTPLEEYYKHDQTLLSSIKAQIDEVKDLSTYLFD